MVESPPDAHRAATKRGLSRPPVRMPAGGPDSWSEWGVLVAVFAYVGALAVWGSLRSAGLPPLVHGAGYAMFPIVVLVIAFTFGRLRRNRSAPTLEAEWAPRGARCDGEEVSPLRRRSTLVTIGTAIGAGALVLRTFQTRSAGGPPTTTEFAVFGAVFLAVCLRYARLLWMGGVHVRWGAFPIRPGPVVFHVATTEGGARLAESRCVLRCLSFAHPRRPAERTATPHVVWSATVELPRERDPGPGDFVEVAFDIPTTAPGTNLRTKTETWWELVLEGRTRLGWFSEPVQVPVYAKEAAVGPVFVAPRG